MLIHFKAIWSILKPLGIFLLAFGILYFPRFGMLNQEKSGNPAPN
jgi:hypothetical protein